MFIRKLLLMDSIIYTILLSKQVIQVKERDSKERRIVLSGIRRAEGKYCIFFHIISRNCIHTPL